MATTGPIMYLMYDGSETYGNLPAFTTSSFYTNIETLVEDAGNTNGGTVSVAQSPNGRWYAKITFADNSAKTGFITWANENHSATVNSIRNDKENLPGSYSDWEDYIATV